LSDPSPNPDNRPNPSKRQDLSSWHAMTGMGLEFITAVALLGGVGWWLDKRWNTSPWLLIAGVGLGFAVGLYRMIVTAKKMFRD
jgi:F0F1-type ATP synthase assembly protein I